MIKKTLDWWKSGTPWIWLNAGAISISLIMVIGVLGLIMVRGLSYFWPSDVVQLQYQQKDGKTIRVIGEIHNEEEVPYARLQAAGETLETPPATVTRYLIKVGNRELLGSDFGWYTGPRMETMQTPKNLVVMERKEWGNLYGYLRAVKEQGKPVTDGNQVWGVFRKRLQRVLKLNDRITSIRKNDIGSINYDLEKLRLKKRRLQLDKELTPDKLEQINKQKQALNKQYQKLERELARLGKLVKRDSFIVEIMDGRKIEKPMDSIVRAYRPNDMNVFRKTGHYIAKFWEFVSDEPREANTEGGIFPAIFGTVLMVLLMSVLVMPLGVIAAICLREYAKQGVITRTIRIAVNNLAGIPSIVYGVFGLGFFVYFLGGKIDQLFYQEALPAPTFGSGGIIWASLTLAIMTLPVVIVATEEGLTRIPRAMHEGSLALGATKSETLWRIIIPMASPAIMTGLILAIARAAGEVAPLMLVGVVKLAPSLPLDWNFPFMHLERKFMHLGFHIYDVGFQSPNVEAARPLVYATSLLLVLVIVGLNLTAVQIRNRLREKYRAMDN